MCFQVYSYLQTTCVDDGHRQVIKMALMEKAWILCHTCFLQPTQLAFTFTHNCAPYIFSVPEILKRNFTELLRVSGMIISIVFYYVPPALGVRGDFQVYCYFLSPKCESASVRPCPSVFVCARFCLHDISYSFSLMAFQIIRYGGHGQDLEFINFL